MTVIATRFHRAVTEFHVGQPLQVQLRGLPSPIMGMVKPADGHPHLLNVVYEIVAEAMESGRLLQITITFAGEDVVWYATQPTAVEQRPSLVTFGGLVSGQT